MEEGEEEKQKTNIPIAQPSIPRQFVWPQSDRISTAHELQAPVVDLRGFFHGDAGPAIERVRPACTQHGFFQVINHGVDPTLMRDVMGCVEQFFKLPLHDKLRVRRSQHCRNWGYAGAHSDRFADKLPWKETLSFGYDIGGPAAGQNMVVDYFVSALGHGFKEMGMVYQKYCEAMTRLSLSIVELLGTSLGDRAHFDEYFSNSSSIMRCNYYPPCQEPELTFGTGPHCDPTSITILLQQDEVEGLEVFSDGEWRVVRPVPGALVINLGDTFMVLSNGEKNIVRPPECLVNEERPRKYPDFTWAELYDFTQNYYRADTETMPSFISWLLSASNAASSSHNTLGG